MSGTPTPEASTGASAVLHGGCLCGQVRYEARRERISTMVCHCRACQRQSGSAFSVFFALPRNDVSWLGELRTYSHTADSGRTVHRRFCPDCGSPVVTEVPGKSGALFIKGGTLDDPSALHPVAHLWCQHKQPWVKLAEGIPCLATQPAGT